jgi:hypothetical protein
MNTQNIIARFIPLTDVAILLLGLLIILMTAAKFDNKSANDEQKNNVIDVIYFYAKTDGSCYLFNPETNKEERFVDTESDKDIRKILDQSKSKVQLLFLISRSGDWDYKWEPQKIDSLKKNWKLDENKHRIFRLTDVPLN